MTIRKIFISAKTHAKQYTLKQKTGEIYPRPSYSVSSIYFFKSIIFCTKFQMIIFAVQFFCNTVE